MDSLVACFRRHRNKGPEANSHVSKSESKAMGSLLETPEGLLPLRSEQGSAKALNTYATGRERGRMFCPIRSRNYVQVWGVLSKGTG